MPPAPISRSTVYRPAREVVSCVNVVIAAGVRVTSAGRWRKGVARRIYEWITISPAEFVSLAAALAGEEGERLAIGHDTLELLRGESATATGAEFLTARDP
jgi:hypothetical protein